MQTLNPAAEDVLQPPPYPIYRFTVEQYHQMIRAGLLIEDDRVELLEGWIVPRLPRGPAHDATIELSYEAIRGQIPSGWRIRILSAITLGDSEPEPDLVVASGPAHRYLPKHPTVEEIGLIIEIAEASLVRDQRDKGRLYARAGIVCYWIVNLIDRQIEVYSNPTGPDAAPRYRQRLDYGVNDAVAVVIGGKEVGIVSVRDVLA